MRGYFEGSFRDNNMAVLQGEYRMPLFWRFRLVGFADIGEVAPNLRGFDLPGIKWTAGGGLHFLLAEVAQIYIRLDYGFSNNSSEFYFFINEAF